MIPRVVAETLAACSVALGPRVLSAQRQLLTLAHLQKLAVRGSDKGSISSAP